jgi:hypothetical protein
VNGPVPAHTVAAVDALAAGHAAEHDFAGWLADVLARLAARLGSSAALTGGRPGSWESADVLHLVQGTVGADDEGLSAYGGPLAT